MTEPNVSSTNLRQLARLWQCETDALVQWQPEELAAIFEHLWAAPLIDELGPLDPQLPEKLQRVEAAPGKTVDTFGDLLRHRQPPLELLNLVKHFAKRAGGDESLPVDVAAVLYAAAICAALVRWDRRITSADDRSLRSKIEWAAARNWIDPATRHLFEEALAELS